MKTWRSYYAISTRTTITATAGRSRDSGGYGTQEDAGPAFGIACPHYPLLRRRAASPTNQTSTQQFCGHSAALAKTL